MCATVCPSQALAYVTPETIAATRREKPVNIFWFGNQKVTTKVFMMAPADADAIAVDVADYMWEGEHEAGSASHLARRSGGTSSPCSRPTSATSTAGSSPSS